MSPIATRFEMHPSPWQLTGLAAHLARPIEFGKMKTATAVSRPHFREEAVVNGKLSGIKFLSGLLLACVSAPPLSHAQQLYWSSRDRIWRANLDGTDPEMLIELANAIGVGGIAIDPFDEKLYWTYIGFESIERANLDGSDTERVALTSDKPLGIAVDPAASKIYWYQWGRERIWRANLDGSNPEPLITLRNGEPSATFMGGVALDIEAGKMYWTHLDNINFRFKRNIRRANLDGSDIEDIIINETSCFPAPQPTEPLGVALDLANRKIYSTYLTEVCGFGRMQRSNFDGSNLESLMDTSLGPLFDITLDLAAQKMYWIGLENNAHVYRIRRANLDGTNIEDTGLVGSAIAIDPGCRGEDCQPNGIPDPCDIDFGISRDCNANDIPDECEPDCNQNSIADDCETDSDFDGVIDECDGCPADPLKTSPGLCGCNSTPEENADSDGDGIVNCVDECPGVDDALFAPCSPEGIPTVSTWGLVVLCLLLLIGAKLQFRRVEDSHLCSS